MLNFRFGKSSKETKQSGNFPGPASYLIPAKFGSEGGKAILISRKTIDLTEVIPGPGAYFSETQRSATPSCKIGKSSKFSKMKDKSPGPAIYSPQGVHKRIPSAMYGSFVHFR